MSGPPLYPRMHVCCVAVRVSSHANNMRGMVNGTDFRQDSQRRMFVRSRRRYSVMQNLVVHVQDSRWMQILLYRISARRFFCCCYGSVHVFFSLLHRREGGRGWGFSLPRRVCQTAPDFRLNRPLLTSPLLLTYFEGDICSLQLLQMLDRFVSGTSTR